MMIDRNGFQREATKGVAEAEGASETGAPASDLAVQAALAGLASHDAPKAAKGPTPGEIKYKLTVMLFPSILLIFVALYVTSLANKVEPEVALFWAGGAGLVLAILARAAVGILGDDSRLVLNDSQIVALARSGAGHEYLAGSGDEQGTTPDSGGADQPSTAASAAGTGGKE
jgi:hypothetical protein